MTVSAASRLRGSRCGYLTLAPTDHVQNTSREVLGQNNTGMPIRFPCRFTGVYISGESSAGAAGQTLVLTLYKGSVAGGNKVFETTFTETGASDNMSVDNTTPAVSEAVCTFVAGDTLLGVLASQATAGTFIELFIAISYETDI